jgi:glycosyltransferase involved in cell wall biosynthesis
MEWIVFGDDWGAHPSTTQHLVLNLPAEDAVIWVDTIGMRKPKLRLTDLKRLWGKARGFLRSGGGSEGGLYRGNVSSFHHVRPKVIPWHDHPAAIRFNAGQLRRALGEGMERLSMREPVLLASYPAVLPYLEAIPHTKLAYLRLDDYSVYPGVDPDLVARTEPGILDRADTILVTARALTPAEPYAGKTHYLPQGVHFDHFASAPLDVPPGKVLGFFGTLSNWLDYDLIAAVAKACPDWELHFVGKVDYLPADFTTLPNVRLFPAVPFRELPRIISSWRAAWVPFQLNSLTRGVNPLKIWEYLAAGLPTHSTPLPEVALLRDRVSISHDAASIQSWLDDVLRTDTPAARAARREGVRNDSWKSRSAALRQIITETRGRSRA